MKGLWYYGPNTCTVVLRYLKHWCLKYNWFVKVICKFRPLTLKVFYPWYPKYSYISKFLLSRDNGFVCSSLIDHSIPDFKSAIMHSFWFFDWPTHLAPKFQYNIIPRGVLSLKVLAELPIIVVLMYQLYKPNVHQEVAEFIPLIMNTITLQPSPVHK